MPIETVDDIITEIADFCGIYGAHGTREDGECEPPAPCRMCFEELMKERILGAVAIELKLGRLHT